MRRPCRGLLRDLARAKAKPFVQSALDVRFASPARRECAPRQSPQANRYERDLAKLENRAQSILNWSKFMRHRRHRKSNRRSKRIRCERRQRGPTPETLAHLKPWPLMQLLTANKITPRNSRPRSRPSRAFHFITGVLGFKPLDLAVSAKRTPDGRAGQRTFAST